ncbi:hypothetical protein SETIT_1G366700v2 [Setaria italica]|uniref:SKP1-like protein n=1 Tax=Setaria italica TaxID=4555 RepID=A0A368PU15_SETIT|nr:SKP1-like protein 11 [Setaria italica]RCV08938.1 hypothetical protein SETIT_1G366700v2 [Setaria italica]
MAAAEGEKKGAMEAEKGEKEAMAAAKGAPVEEKGNGAEAPEEEGTGEAAVEKGKAVAEAEEAAGAKMITLRSADGEERSMSAAAAKLSVVLSNMIEDDCAYNVVIPLERSTTVARTLDTVIEYCVKHADEPVHDSNPSTAGGSSSVVVTAVPEDLEEWDRKLVEGLSADDLYDLLLAANHLSIQGLIDVVCQRAADMIKGKTTQQIRDTFNLPNDLTPADEAKLRQQHAWVID